MERGKSDLLPACPPKEENQKEKERAAVPKLNSVIEILKLLDGSNCRECGSPTCLAFAADVFNTRKRLGDCPKLDAETLALFEGEIRAHESLDRTAEEVIEQLKRQLAGIDLEASAKRLGAEFSDGRITIRCLGKKFSVDTNGEISTDIHVNPWIAGPVFNYILKGAGVSPSGTWVRFRDLDGGKPMEALFKQRCEKPLARVADTNPDFFGDLVRVFSGKQVQNHYQSDVSLVLHPLPKVPILICYWKQDGDLPSDMNIFFDSTADKNLDIDSIYTVSIGLSMMFQKIARSHRHEIM
jgi:hypothetical protein